MRTVTAALIAGALASALGVAATLRALLFAGMWLDLDELTLRQGYAVANVVLTGGVTVALFAGVVLLRGGRQAGRAVLVGAGVVVVALTVLEFAVWLGLDNAGWIGVVGVIRWAFALMALATIFLTVLPSTKCDGVDNTPPSKARRRSATLGTAVAALGTAGYLCWLTWRQYAADWPQFIDGPVFGLTFGAVLSQTMLELVIAAVAAAAVLLVGAVLSMFGVALGRWLLVAAAAVTLGQTVYNWTEFARLLYEVGALEMLDTLAPRDAVAVGFTVVAPLIVLVLTLWPTADRR